MKHFNLRLEQRNWVIATKALTVIHRIFREGSEIFLKSISRTGVLDLNFFKDETDNFSLTQSKFVVQYALYLSQKAKVYREFDREYEKSSENFEGLDIKLCLQIIPSLQKQFDCILEFKDKMGIVSTRICLTSFGLLLKDSFRLFTALNKLFLKVIGHSPFPPTSYSTSFFLFFSSLLSSN